MSEKLEEMREFWSHLQSAENDIRKQLTDPPPYLYPSEHSMLTKSQTVLRLAESTRFLDTSQEGSKNTIIKLNKMRSAS